MTSEGSAVVAGGGIGGVTAAIALRRAGWDVVVLERAPELREVGAGLSIAPNALRALDAIGVGEDVRAAATPSWAAGNLRLPGGEYLRRADPEHDTALSCFHRADLHRLLAARLPAGTVRTGATVTGVSTSAAGATVRYRTAEGEYEMAAGLVVGADGIHSTVRATLWPDAPAPRFRYTAWRGVTRPGSVWPEDGTFTFGPGAYFLAHPIGGERVYWALGVHADTPGVRYPDNLAEVRRRLTGWHRRGRRAARRDTRRCRAAQRHPRSRRAAHLRPRPGRAAGGRGARDDARHGAGGVPGRRGRGHARRDHR
ncbi:FAD-dependent oxidoreductase [Amycolatopsis thermoflava]|uniref:FAD-dependent oxidoreductase n=1 Tax=Amycolatopsis thermoflava TaxID=84480 RepID=UPI0003F8524E|nr:FAD-dependent monooxygenase [Amycolatopsis thermoflava]